LVMLQKNTVFTLYMWISNKSHLKTIKKTYWYFDKRYDFKNKCN